jgi:hypothetical protein
MKRFAIPAIALILIVALLVWWVRPDSVNEESDRARDGFLGQVQSATVETAPLVDHLQRRRESVRH